MKLTRLRAIYFVLCSLENIFLFMSGLFIGQDSLFWSAVSFSIFFIIDLVTYVMYWALMDETVK